MRGESSRARDEFSSRGEGGLGAEGVGVGVRGGDGGARCGDVGRVGRDGEVAELELGLDELEDHGRDERALQSALGHLRSVEPVVFEAADVDDGDEHERERREARHLAFGLHEEHGQWHDGDDEQHDREVELEGLRVLIHDGFGERGGCEREQTVLGDGDDSATNVATREDARARAKRSTDGTRTTLAGRTNSERRASTETRRALCRRARGKASRRDGGY